MPLIALALLTVACNDDGRGGDDDAGVTGIDSRGPGDGGLEAGDADAGDGPTVLDVATPSGGSATAGDGEFSCKISDGSQNAGIGCDDVAPAGSFEPDVQWEKKLAAPYALVTPMVANFTDDDGSGEIDLCDVPDILVVSYTNINLMTGEVSGTQITLLDGETGDEHWSATGVDGDNTPAIGDIDGDGLVEVVTSAGRKLIAFEHDGTVKWTSADIPDRYTSIALADLDADGDVEIIADSRVYDHEGNLEWKIADGIAGTQFAGSATTAADLDEDGEMEVIFGSTVYTYDGNPVWSDGQVSGGFPHVANLDNDPEPEILVTTHLGVSMFDHDGTLKFLDQRPTGDPGGFPDASCRLGCPWAAAWIRPAAIHDFDGDGRSEFAMSSGSHYTVFKWNMNPLWTADVSDASGIASGTAFDFLGDGIAEAIYGDENFSLIYDGRTGDVLLSETRTSRTITEYPVVVDVDNDQSAEIIVTSSDDINGGEDAGFTVKVVRDVGDRWIPARRIWNQHTYHVTNVNEDGTIPQHEAHHWKQLNTFRTNAQLSRSGGVCKPVVG